MGENNDQIRELIIELCKAEGSQVRFAKRIGATPQKVGNWVNGRNNPGADAVVSISKAYGIPVESIVGRSSTEYSFVGLNETICPDIDEVSACMRKMTDKQRQAILAVARAMVE